VVRGTRIAISNEASTLLQQKQRGKEELKPEFGPPRVHEKGPMTRHQLIREVIQQFPQLSPQQAEAIVKAVFAVLTEALARGECIELRDFGSFGVKQHRPRAARDPRTGALLAVPAKTVAFFRAAQALRERVQGPEGRCRGRGEKTDTRGGLAHEH
jgi:integration host factor subunit beta